MTTTKPKHPRNANSLLKKMKKLAEDVPNKLDSMNNRSETQRMHHRITNIKQGYKQPPLMCKSKNGEIMAVEPPRSDDYARELIKYDAESL